MNKRFIDSKSNPVRKKRIKNLIISIVILLEIIAIVTVASYAWVETVSSIKITNEANTTDTIDTYVFTDAMIGKKAGTIDLAGYFKQSGDMHFAPCSSADGKTMYFPFNTAAGTAYRSAFRKGNVSDKNTGYISISLRIKVDVNADFFFTQVPTVDNNIRVSVTARSEGSVETPITTIYANNASTTPVVNSSSGATGATTVKAFSNHIKGKGTTNRLFAVGGDETKIVTINVWYQSTAMDDSAVSADRVIQNLGITSSLTPRHVTLIPTPTWDISGTTEYFYAWCWNASNSADDRLYKLELDANEHYAFDYNGTYRDTLFFRCGNANLTTESMSTSWSSLGLWNKTADTSIPNSPENPTYVIQTISGGAYDGDIGGNKSTGSWVDPAIINFDYVTDQTTDFGTITATTYRGTSVNANDVMEASNATATLHNKTVHAWPAKKVCLTATAKSGYRFVGWYTNPAGSGTAASTNATYDFDAPSAATEVSYYAKFVKTYTFKLQRVVDGSTTSTAAAGTLTVNGSATGNTATSKSVTVDQGSSVTFTAAAATGYTLDGIFTTQTGTTTATSPVTLSNNNITYYARFTPISYNVTAHSRYLNGSSYTTTDSTTGGTVTAGSAAAGASSTASVKYKSSVTLTATPASGYAFVGWFTSTSATTATSTSTSYSYTLSTTGAKNFYARFRQNTFTVTANARYSTNGGSSYSSGNTGGTVKVGSSTAGATSSASVTVNSNVTLTASAASGYTFIGWYTAATGGTELSTSASYSYTLADYANVNVYARFIADSWTLDYGVSGAASWNSVAASVSGNNVTASLTLTEGQDFSFQIVKTAGSTDTWYGGGGTYQNITSTSFISNKTLSAGGGDIYMKGHAGTYTFTFNKSTNVLNVTASYSNITITLNDTSSNSWIHNDGAIIYLDASGYSGILMTKTSDTTWTASIPSNTRTGQIQFKRNNSGNTETWNTFTWNSRGYGTSFNAP